MKTPTKHYLLLFLILLLTGCGGDPGGGGQTEKFSLSVSPASADVFQGARKLVEVTLTRHDGFTDDVEVSLESLPEGVRASTLIFRNGVKTTLLELSTSSTLKVGSVLKLTIQGVSGTAKTTTALQLTVKEAAPSSQELIQQALEAGTIDYGTSLLYRAYALFGDPTLPEAFIGSGSDEEDIGLFVEVQEANPRLVAEILAKLEPFLVRPSDPESFFNTPASQAELTAQADANNCEEAAESRWISKRSSLFPVRVWLPCGNSVVDDNFAGAALDEVLGMVDKFYISMTELMGPPTLDGTGPDNLDNAIDIYLTPFVKRAGRDYPLSHKACAYPVGPFNGRKSSGLILFPLNILLTDFDSRATLMHEFFHVLQFAHNYGILNNWWFTEASATWAAVHFDRTLWKDERVSVPDLERFMYSFQNKLESLHISQPVLHKYAAYIWPYFVEQETDGAAFMGAIWRGLESAATHEGGNNVIDNVFDFKDNFHTFALRNLVSYDFFGNTFSARQRYTSLDPLFPKFAIPEYRKDKTLTDIAKTLDVPLKLPSLSADYVRFLVENRKIRKVKFDFSGLDRAHLDIDSLINYKNGGWKLEAMTNNELTLCFDKPNEEADDFWFVLSNYSKNLSDLITGGFTVQTYATCEDSWVGTSRSIITDASPTYEISANVTWNYDEGSSLPERGRYVYKPEGTVFFTSLVEGCTVSPSSQSINGGELVIDYSTDPPSYRGTGITLWEATYTCPDVGPIPWGAGGTWFQAEGKLEPDDRTIQGTKTSSGQTFTFNFTRQ